MNNKQIKNLLPLLALVLTMAVCSSCNRGMGCPNNFKAVQKVAVDVAPAIATAIVK